MPSMTFSVPAGAGMHSPIVDSAPAGSVEVASAQGLGLSGVEAPTRPVQPWSERLIARAIALQTFKRRYLMAVPNCNWTGHECDLLVVTDNLRIIDVEVKISRADLKADAKKEKWWHRKLLGHAAPREVHKNGRLQAIYRDPIYDNAARLHPPKVWKHYYALPKDIWIPALEACLPSAASGILLIHRDFENGYPKPAGHRPEITIQCIRRATPNREAKPISAEAAVDIARLASLRMWESFQQLEAARGCPP